MRQGLPGPAGTGADEPGTIGRELVTEIRLANAVLWRITTALRLLAWSVAAGALAGVLLVLTR